MKKQKVKTPKLKIQAQTHDTLPASVGLVKEIRDELRADIRSVEHGMRSMEHTMRSMEHGLNSKIDQVNSRVEQVNSKVEQVMVSVHRSQVLMEEQRGENRIVLDGIKNLFVRQERIENDFGELRGTVRALGAGAKRAHRVR